MFTLIAPVNNSGFFFSTAEILTRRVFYRPEDIKSIDQANKIKKNPETRKKNDKDSLNTWQKGLASIKLGHLLGGGWLLSVVGGKWLKNKFNLSDDSFINAFINLNAPFGSVGGIVSLFTAFFHKNQQESTLLGKLDKFVERNTVNKDGTFLNRENEREEDLFPSFDDDLVMDVSDKEGLVYAIENTQRKGVGGFYIFTGVTRCGKTMTAKCMARKLAEIHPSGKAQFWFATEDAMDRSIADDSKAIGSIFGSETTAERIERILSYAVLEDSPVVILLDEGHLFLGDKSTGRFDPNDPHHRSKVMDAFQKLVSEKLQSKKCPNIHLVITANSSGKAIAVTMEGRSDASIFFDNASFESRQQLIRNVLKKEMTARKNELNIDYNDLTEEDFKNMAEKGTENVLKHYSSRRDDSENDIAGCEAEARADGFGGKLALLTQRPLLNFQTLQRIVERGLSRYIKEKVQGKSELIRIIKEGIEHAIEKSIKTRRFKAEVLHYFGDSERRSNSSTTPEFDYQQLATLLNQSQRF